MSEQATFYTAILGGFLILLLLWAGSLVFVNWDAYRRGLSTFERRMWLALTAFLPPFGLFAYLFARFGGFSEPQPPIPVPPEIDRRSTGLRPPQGEVRMPTIPAAAYVDHKAAPERPAAPGPTPTRRSQAEYQLDVIRGPHAGSAFPLMDLPTRIGRGADQPIRLDGDLAVSRSHAEVYARENSLRIRDLNSTHGTLVNGRAAADQRLEPGDQIQVGSTVMVVKSRRA
jgi:hypothetical protein